MIARKVSAQASVAPRGRQGARVAQERRHARVAGCPGSPHTAGKFGQQSDHGPAKFDAIAWKRRFVRSQCRRRRRRPRPPNRGDGRGACHDRDGLRRGLVTGHRRRASPRRSRRCTRLNGSEVEGERCRLRCAVGFDNDWLRRQLTERGAPLAVIPPGGDSPRVNMRRGFFCTLEGVIAGLAPDATNLFKVSLPQTIWPPSLWR